MAKRTWTRCKCGEKLHVKKSARLCYKCLVKTRKTTHE